MINQHKCRVRVLLAVGASCVLSEGAWINELHYDNVGSDTGEFVEIAGPAGTDLNGWEIRLYNGGNQKPYSPIINLAGILADSGNGFGFIAFEAPGIQNGSPDGLALIDDNNSVIQFLSYEGVFTALTGAAAGRESEDIGVEESDATTSEGHSLQLGGVGSSYSDFTWRSPLEATPGAANRNQSFATTAAVPDSGTSLAMLAMVAGMIPFAVRYTRR